MSPRVSRSGVWALAALAALELVGGVASAVDLNRPTGSSPAVRAAVHRIEQFDEQARGLSYEKPVDVHLASAGEFQRLLRSQNNSDESDIEAATSTLVALGLIDPKADLKKSLRALLDADVVGFYDNNTKRLYVRGGKVTPFTRLTLAHELTHALQDQHFRLARFNKLKDEPASAATSLIEGDAVRIEKKYGASFTAAESIGYQIEAARLGGSSNIPPVLENLLAFPYIAGPPFVEAVYARGGNAAVDAMFRDPPTTTEQILHPDRYFDRQPELDVKAPEPAGKVVDRGQLGEYGLRLVLSDGLDAPTAAAAADGWGGDRYVTWRAGGRAHFGARIVMDSEREAVELQSAFDRWTVRHRSAHVTRERATINLTVDGPR